jgi:5-methylcytosine-specific restriction endonuclease McrA
MNLRDISNDLLLSRAQSLAQKERDLSLEVLQHLREIERRSLYAKCGYPSLFEYAVQELKYSQGAAHRRIASMRLLKEIPEMEAKLERGEMSLSTLSRAQTFFRQERSQVKTRDEKVEILKVLENKSAREVERELVCRSTEPEKLMPERLRPISETHSELKILLNTEMLKELEELKCLLSHARPNASLKELLEFALRDTLTRLRPRRPQHKSKPAADQLQAKKAARPALPTSELEQQSSKRQSAEQKSSEPRISRPTRFKRYIAQHIKREVWHRDGGICTYVDPVSGKCCGSKHFLEYDHIHPVALGGESCTDNLRLRCRAHNQVAALGAFGHFKTAKFVSRMR